MLGHGHDVGARDFGDGDTAVGLVGCVEVDVVGADACRYAELEVLGFCETLGGEVTGVESIAELALNSLKDARSADSELLGVSSRLSHVLIYVTVPIKQLSDLVREVNDQSSGK